MTSQLILKKGREKPILQQHPWLFSGAIKRIEGDPKAGEIVEVRGSNGCFLALAYYNPHSQIRGRVLAWDEIAIDTSFWRTQLQRALTYRQKLQLEPETTAYRLLNAESDGLPGLVVDKYGDYLVMQCLTLGIDQRKQLLVDLLVELLQPKGIIERSDVAVRKKEGLTAVTGLLYGQEPPEQYVVLENGHQFSIQLLAGHKTGLYLDQRDNRALVCQPQHIQDAEVLNVFAYTGGFGVYATPHAKSIMHIDSSIPALEQAEYNTSLNAHRPQDEYLAGDAFEILRDFREEGKQYDLVVLDPPKFAHSQRDITRATRGYKDLNLQALHLVREGGLLATFSCSGLISADLFQKVLFGACIDAGRTVQIMHYLHQASDHPTSLTVPESAYLKGFLCRVW